MKDVKNSGLPQNSSPHSSGSFTKPDGYRDIMSEIMASESWQEAERKNAEKQMEEPPKPEPEKKSRMARSRQGDTSRWSTSFSSEYAEPEDHEEWKKEWEKGNAKTALTAEKIIGKRNRLMKSPDSDSREKRERIKKIKLAMRWGAIILMALISLGYLLSMMAPAEV